MRAGRRDETRWDRRGAASSGQKHPTASSQGNEPNVRAPPITKSAVNLESAGLERGGVGVGGEKTRPSRQVTSPRITTKCYDLRTRSSRVVHHVAPRSRPSTFRRGTRQEKCRSTTPAERPIARVFARTGTATRHSSAITARCITLVRGLLKLRSLQPTATTARNN